MKLFIDESLLEYIGTYCFGASAGDINYIAEFDVNGDGKIDMKDIAWFGDLIGQWVETPPTLYTMFVPVALGLGGVLAGYLIAKVL